MKIQNLGQAMGIEIPLIVPVVLIIYMIAILAIGLWSARKVKNSEDWFVGGRSMGPWITALAHGSSSLGGGMYIAGPQYGWEAGDLNRELGEIVVSVKMPITRDGTKRPREPLL